MSLIFVVQRLDRDDPVLGVVPDLIRALSERTDHLTVIANEVGTFESGDRVSVRSLGKERGAGRPRRAFTYIREMRAAMAPRPDAIIAHMCPVYVDVVAPLAKAHGVPMLLWFAHPAVSRTLRIADRLTDAILTSLPGAYPLPGSKVHVIGQAIDLDMFPPAPTRRCDGGLRLLALGRTSPSKGLSTMIRAVSRLLADDVDVRLRIVGPATTSAERGHREALRAAIAAHGAADAISLEEGVRRHAIPELIGNADLLVNAMVAGSGDKVVFEAMARERLVVASNPSLAPLLSGLPLSLMFREGDDRDLASVLAVIAAADPRVRADAAAILRRRVEEQHSVGHWADRVIEVVASLRTPARV